MEGRFLAEGVRVVEDLLGSGLPIRLVVASSTLEDTERGGVLIEEVRRRGLPLRAIPASEFDGLAATESPQGVLAIAETPVRDLDSLCGDEPEIVLVLDGVQDPGNFGTLVRSADALGAVGVIVLPGTVDPWNPKSVRSAAGSAFRQPIVQAGWSEAAGWLERMGFEVLAAEVGGGAIVRRASRTALVLGNEGAGVSAEVLAGVDRTVGIPLRGRAESLNVAAAAAILLYELTR